MKKLLYILLYIWQLPQNIAGLVYMLFMTDRKKILHQRGATFYICRNQRGGITLGEYIFLSVENIHVEPVYDHEFGHVRQSRILGWLYLPVVGLFSLIHAACCHADNYYHVWTETWANHLGGIPGYAGEYHHHRDGVIVTAYDKLVEFYHEYKNAA